MERLLGELHHLMTLCPGIQTAVHKWRWDDIGPVGQGCAEVVDALAAVYHAHTLAHQFLLRIGRAEIVELLAPLIDLVAKVYFDGADCLTTQAERTGADIAGVILSVAEHAEFDADGAGDEITI